MRPSATARRYAEAAFDVARQDGDIEGWLSDLRTATGILQSQAAAQYFKDPSVAIEHKMQALEQRFGDLRPHALNLLRVLVTRHRLHLLPAILAEFEDLEREARGILEADITVARELDENERARISVQLDELTGRSVEVRTHVDPQILGGVVIRIGDRLIDTSIAGRLQRLRQEMAV